MEATSRLLNSDPFLKGKEADQLFYASFKEMSRFHYNHHPYIKAIYDEVNLLPEQISHDEDLLRAPMITVSLFKEYELKSVPEEEIVLHLTSSGTGGKKSHQFLDQISLDNVKKSALAIHAGLGVVSSEVYNYFCFTYDPKVANDLGTAFTDELLTSFTQKNEVYYTFQWNEEKKDFIFDAEKALEKLRHFSKSPHPTRILGFPAFLYQMLQDPNLDFKLNPNSWVQTGGGWKGFKDQEIPKEDFKKLVQEKLAIPIKNNRDMFGMVEHGIPYVDCEKGNLHIPNFSRIIIRDPVTLKSLPIGETGLMQFICTYNFSYPSFNILSTDYGKKERCNCSIGGEVIIPMGRAGITKHKGCAIKALELAGAQR